jgi:hypothetical protein
MQIKLYGNGHSCNIPVQEIIDKYWKDETAPFSFEMSTAIGYILLDKELYPATRED